MVIPIFFYKLKKYYFQHLRRASEWSMRGHGADVVDFYCDDELRPDDPNMQLQILTEVDEDEEEDSKAKKKKPYPPKPMLVDQGTCSILFYKISF